MISQYDGGPAFSYEHSQQSGMTLRDYFAAHADVKDMVSQYLRATNNSTPDFQEIIDLTADAKYKLADAMLNEREK